MSVEKIIEDENFFIITLKSSESAKEIYFEIEKNIWRENISEKIFLEMPTEKIILMNR